MLTRQDNYIDMCTYYSTLLTLGTLIINKCSIRCLQMVDNSTEKGGYNMVEFSTTFLVVGKFHHIISTFFCGIIHHPRAGGKFFHHLQAGGKNFHHLEAGGNIPPFLVEIFPPSASRWKIFPPYTGRWKKIPPSGSRWKHSTLFGGNFSTICKQVENISTIYRQVEKKFHHLEAGGNIPPFLVEIFPPSASRWKIFPPYTSRWK